MIFEDLQRFRHLSYVEPFVQYFKLTVVIRFLLLSFKRNTWTRIDVGKREFNRCLKNSYEGIKTYKMMYNSGGRFINDLWIRYRFFSYRSGYRDTLYSTM